MNDDLPLPDLPSWELPELEAQRGGAGRRAPGLDEAGAGPLLPGRMGSNPEAMEPSELAPVGSDPFGVQPSSVQAELEIDESALRTFEPEGEEPALRATYRVRVGAVRDPVALAAGLAEVLAVDLATAQRIAVNAPGVLLSEVTQPRALQVAAQVRRLGAHAAVEDAEAAVKDSAETSGGRAPAPPSVGMAQSDGGEEVWHEDDFWEQAPIAFIAPVLGKGSVLLAACGGIGVAVGVGAVIPGGLLKLGGVFGLQLVAFGLFMETFNRLAQAAIYREVGQRLPEPISSMPSMSELFWRGVLNAAVLFVLAIPGGAVAFYTRNLFAIAAAQLLLFCYWPMALTVQSVSGRLAGPLDAIAVARGIAVAPLEYAVVCALVFLAIVASAGVALALTGAGALAVGGGEAGLGGGALMVTLVSFVWFAAVGYFHGVLGYLMGSLVRAKSDAFDFLLKD